MGTLWEQAGKLVSNDAGTALLECETCPCVESGVSCVACEEGTTPARYKATVAGLTGIYAVYNGEYILPQWVEQGGPCQWRWAVTDPNRWLEFSLIQTGVGSVQLWVHFYNHALDPPVDPYFEAYFLTEIAVEPEQIDCTNPGSVYLFGPPGPNNSDTENVTLSIGPV